MHAAEEPLVAGVELGGTKCVCLLASGPGAIAERVVVPTSDPSTTLAAISRVLERWRVDRGFAALGIGAFGPLELDPASHRYGRMLGTPKPGWRDIDLIDGLSVPQDQPVGIDTDVGGAALAEGRWGGAVGLRTYAYVTVGTGVGVGIVVDGRNLRGLGHPEAGHMRVPRMAGDAWPGACAYHGDCVEGLASGAAIAGRLGLPAELAPPDDPVWATAAHALAGMAHNLFVTFAPERILIGGGLALGQPHLLVMVRRMVRDSLAAYGAADRFGPELDAFIRPPELGHDAGPLGAIAVALDALGTASPASRVRTL